MTQKKFKTTSNRNYLNYIIIGFIILVSVALIQVQNDAKKQNKLLIDDYLLYQEADSLLQEGNIESVIPMLEELYKTYTDDYNVTHRLGYAYLSTSKYDAALTMYTKSLGLNPYLVENKDFLYEYAIILANKEQNDNAIVVIDRLLTLPMDDAFKGKVTELRDSISNNMKGTTP